MSELYPSIFFPEDLVYFPYKGERKLGYIWEVGEDFSLVYLYEDRDTPNLVDKLLRVKTQELQGE